MPDANNIPEPTERNIKDFSEVIIIAKEIKEGIQLHGYYDTNLKQYLFEETMKAVFGDDYFTWHNKMEH